LPVGCCADRPSPAPASADPNVLAASEDQPLQGEQVHSRIQARLIDELEADQRVLAVHDPPQPPLAHPHIGQAERGDVDKPVGVPSSLSAAAATSAPTLGRRRSNSASSLVP